MLFGFDSAETADSVLEKMQTAVNENSPGGMEMAMDMNMDVSLDVSDGTTSSSIGLTGSGNLDININKESSDISMEGTLTTPSLLGLSQSVTMKMYGITSEDGAFDTYVYREVPDSGEEGVWTHSSPELFGLNMEEIMKQTIDTDFFKWDSDFELASEPVTADGTECYLLSTEIDTSSLGTSVEEAAEMFGIDISSNENAEMVTSMLDGLRVKLEYYVSTADYFPVRFHMDLNGSDLSALSQYLAMAMGGLAEGSSIDLVANDISMDVSVSYGDAKEIIVPEEALTAPETEDVLGKVKNILGELAG